jgi:hypothetical protein
MNVIMITIAIIIATPMRRAMSAGNEKIGSMLGARIDLRRGDRGRLRLRKLRRKLLG